MNDDKWLSDPNGLVPRDTKLAAELDALADKLSQTTVIELPATMRDPMRKTMNKGLMVAFINADLLNRAGLDVRKSYVLYDDAGLFEYALTELPDAALLQRLYDSTNIRFYSKGI